MRNIVGDHQTTAAVTVSKKHVGEVELSGRAAQKRDLDLQAHRARMEGNRWAAFLKILIRQRDEVHETTDPDSLFIGRTDEACIAFAKREAAGRGASIGEAMRKMKESEGRAAEFERQIVELEAQAVAELSPIVKPMESIE